MDEPSIFTRIINREIPADIVYEDETVIVFLSLENYPLVVPKAPVRDIYALDDATAAAIMRVAARTARALRRAIECDGVLLWQSNGAAAGQEVYHFHLHVYPRWHGDRMRLELPERDSSEGARSDLLERLHAAWA